MAPSSPVVLSAIAILLVPTLGAAQHTMAAGDSAALAKSRRVPVLDRRARLVAHDAPLSEALNRLTELSGVVIAFSPSVLGADRRIVSCDCDTLTVRQALDLMLRASGFWYSVVNGHVMIFRDREIEDPPDRGLSFQPPTRLALRTHPIPSGWLARAPMALELQQQARPIAGTVVGASGHPVAGARVRLRANATGDESRVTTSDEAGRFRFPALSGADAMVDVVAIGFRPLLQTVRVGDENVRLVLTESAVNLDELVVTGTVGETQRRAIGNAVGIVDMAEVTLRAPPVDIQHMLSTNVPGVRIINGTGEVGAGGVSRIRGAASLSLPRNPIVYVDGVRVNGLDNEVPSVPAQAAGTGVDPQARPSRINDFNPNEIESIEVIKGPAAATLYGTEASNGVIQIITKRGRTGRPAVELRGRQGAAWLPDPVNLYNPTYYRSRSGQVVEFNALQNDLSNGFPSPFQTGHAQSLGSSLYGGSETLKYFFSGDFDRDEGPVSYNWKNKLSGRANLSYTPSSKFSADVNIGAVRSRMRSAVAGGGNFVYLLLYACPAPGCEPGSGLPNAADGPWRGYFGSTPEIFRDEFEGHENVDRFTLGVSLKHNPFPWFNHRLTVGGDFGDNESTELCRATGNPGNGCNFGRKEVLNLHNQYVTADYAATATVRPVTDLSLATSGGAQFYQRRTNLTYARGERFPTVALETISAGATKLAEESVEENRTFGLYVQEQLGWKNRLFLTGAIRGDDNSAFGQNFDFVVYPKLSASWVVTDEPFLANNSILRTLKLRAAWGKAGQQPDVFAALRTYAPAVGPGGTSELTPQNIGNPDLEPEVSREIEAGFDASLLDDRLAIEATYYDQRTSKAIVRIPTLPSLGFPGFQFQNLGVVQNRGFELALRGTVLRGEKVSLDLGVNYSRNKNKVVDLGGQLPLVESPFWGAYHVEGFPLGSLFLKRVVSASIIQNASGQNIADPASLMCEGGQVEPGTPNLSRGGGAAVPCAQAPFVFFGQPLPQWDGSVHATLTLLGNLQLYGLVDYVGGRTLASGDLDGVHSFFFNSRAAVDRTDPILLGYQALGSQGWRQPGIIDAGFAKLRTVSATYRLPPGLARKVGGSSASVTVAGENFATLWRAQDGTFGHRQVDPEVTQQLGSTATRGLSPYHQYGFPQLRRFIMTLRLTL